MHIRIFFIFSCSLLCRVWGYGNSPCFSIFGCFYCLAVFHANPSHYVACPHHSRSSLFFFHDSSLEQYSWNVVSSCEMANNVFQDLLPSDVLHLWFYLFQDIFSNLLYVSHLKDIYSFHDIFANGQPFMGEIKQAC